MSYICCTYVVYARIRCLNYMYVFAPWLSRPPGAKSHGKRNLQIQGCIQIFETITLNRVLILPDCRSRSQLSESGLRSQKGPLGAEL